MLEAEPPHLDPLEDPPRPTLEVVNGLIYEPLLECAGREFRPALADKWEWSSDGTRLMFQLRKEARWPDGGAVTTGDVQASVEAFLRGRSRFSVAAAALTDVVAVESSAAGSVRLRLARPAHGVLAALCDVPIVPIALARGPRGGKASALRERPAGTGPFRLATRERGRIRLVRNPATWRGMTAVEEIVFESETDPWRGLRRARDGEVDLMAHVPLRFYPDQVRRSARVRDVELRRVRDERYSFLAINHQHPVLADTAVRRALSLMWNRAELAEEVHHGLAEATAGPFGSAVAAYNPQQAVRALDEAGWRDQNGDGIRERGDTALRLRVPYAAGGALDVEVRRFSSGLQRIGVRLEASATKPEALLERLRRRDFELIPLTWRGRAGEDPGPLVGAAGRFNHGAFRSPRVESLLEQWRRADTPALRDGVSRRLGEVIAEEVPAIFLYRHDDLVLVKKRVRGLCSESGRLDLRGVWLEAAVP